MNNEQLEDLKEIEKDFDAETALKVYKAGYRKVFNKYTCQHCGKEFTGHTDKSLSVVKFKTDIGTQMARVRLCPSCLLDLLERRDKVDDEFFSELKTNAKSD